MVDILNFLNNLKNLNNSEIFDNNIILSKFNKIKQLSQFRIKVMSFGKKVLFYCCLYINEEMQVMTPPNDVTLLEIEPDEYSTEM